MCPAGNVSVGERVVFSGRCEVCYACVQNCPKGAIHLPSERSGARYRNEHVRLADIIAANNQMC